MKQASTLIAILLLTAEVAAGEEISELPKNLHGHYAVWASIESDGDISTKLEKNNLPLFFVGPRHVVTIGVGTIFDRIEMAKVGGRTFYTCHPHPASGENARDIVIESLGGGVLLFTENGAHLLCKRTERTLGPGLHGKKAEVTAKRNSSEPHAQRLKEKSVSQTN